MKNFLMFAGVLAFLTLAGYMTYYKYSECREYFSTFYCLTR